MNATLSKLLIVIFVGVFLPVIGEAGEPFVSKPVELTATDVATGLKLKWWKQRLQFDQPVKVVRVTLCELRRNTDGTWTKLPLSGRHGSDSGPNMDFKDITVTICIPEGKGPPEWVLILGSTSCTETLETRPDFSKMNYTFGSGRVLDGCILLAAQLNGRSPDENENIVRALGLEIETE